MMRFRRAWLTSLPSAWLLGTVFILAATKLCEVIPQRDPGGPAQDTYYVVSHDRYVAHVALVFVIFAGLYAVLSRVTRFGYRKPLGWLHFWLTFAGINISLLPILIMPRCCMPRRFDDLPRTFAILNDLSLAGLLVCGFAMLTFIAVLVDAFMRRAPREK